MNSNDFIYKAKLIHGDRYDYSLVLDGNIKTKYSVMCKIHGIFEQRGDAHLSGQGCGKCKKSILKSEKEFINEVNVVHNHKYDYSNVKYINSKTMININCKNHGEFNQIPDNHLCGHGCPKCGFEATADSKKENASNSFIDNAKLIHGNKYDYSRVEYVDAKTKVIIVCDKHGVFEQTPNDHLSGKSCLYCSLSETKPEFEIKALLNTLNIEYIENERTILNGKEIDIYIPSHKLGIEYNGLYWHSHLFKEKKYHINKTNDSEKNNIQLIQVFEDEWINKRIVVESIIKSKLGIYENRIFARKCQIKEIESKEVSEFLKKNHLQGTVGSAVKIGLYYENELISIMTFGKKRVSMGNKVITDGEFEMMRFCNKLNTQVIGGASKLFKYFLRTYKPTHITTFADRRYSNGDLYFRLGFKHLYNTDPNYFYVKKNELIREYRFKYRKDILVKDGFDGNKTEYQIMDDRGYFRIFDSGNMKFEMNF